MEREKIDDNELLYMIHQQDDVAFQYLMHKYEADIRMVISSYMRMNYRYQDIDDFMQLAALKLLEAVQEFKPGICQFRSFYFNILRHAMIDMLRRMNSYSERKELYALSLDMQVEDQHGTYTLLDTVEAKNDTLSKTYGDLRLALAFMKTKLDSVEWKIIELRAMGYTYKQIAQEQQISIKKVDNTLRKIRKAKKNRKSN